MLARRNRFHGRNSLRAVYRRGQTVRGPIISLKYSARDGRPMRLGVVVSRKVSKSAVVRNRIRRRIYESIRLHSDQLTGQDLVVTVYDEKPATMEASQLDLLLNELFSKAGLLK